MKTLGYLAFGVLVVLSLPVVLPIMVIRNMMDARYQRRIVNDVACGRCGEVLGSAAILESDRLMNHEWKRMRNLLPRVRYRRIRRHQAVCTNCGQEFFFSNQGKTYLPVFDG